MEIMEMDTAEDDLRSTPVPTTSEGIALCLSGGGFRATLFHLGALRRLNELGVLKAVSIISSVSGGSILNGVLATQWHKLRSSSGNSFDNFVDVIVHPVHEFCKRDLRTRLLVVSRFNPLNALTFLRTYFAVPGQFLALAYSPFFRNRLLAELPDPIPAKTPRFIFCATNV